MKAAYELRREFSESPEGHYKGGANDTEFSSGDARPGYMNGPKEGEKGASFGSVLGIAEGGMSPVKNARAHARISVRKLVFEAKTNFFTP
jgi:hypothetical protein